MNKGRRGGCFQLFGAKKATWKLFKQFYAWPVDHAMAEKQFEPLLVRVELYERSKKAIDRGRRRSHCLAGWWPVVEEG